MDVNQPERRNRFTDAFFGAVLDALPHQPRILVTTFAHSLWNNARLQVMRDGRPQWIDNPHYRGKTTVGISKTIKEMIK